MSLDYFDLLGGATHFEPDDSMEVPESEVLDAFSGAPKPNSDGWIRINCTFCQANIGKKDKKASFGINVSNGYYNCFRCHVEGWVKDIPEWLIGDHVVAEKRDFEEDWADTPWELPEIDPPVSFTPLWRDPGKSATILRGARLYLYKRGVSFDAWEALNIGACFKGRFKDRVVIPQVTREGVLVGFVARDWTGTADRKYLNSKGMTRTLLNENVLSIETDEPAILVEGPFDILPYYDRAAAWFGKPTEKQITRVISRAKRPLAVCLDGDSHVEGDLLAMRFRLEGVSAGSVRLPATFDPDEVDRERFLECCRKCIHSKSPVIY